MARALISYFSRSGTTEKIAKSIKEGLKFVDSINIVLKKIQKTTLDDLASCGIIIGSPSYSWGAGAKNKSEIKVIGSKSSNETATIVFAETKK